jgi:hypothetical protein
MPYRWGRVIVHNEHENLVDGLKIGLIQMDVGGLPLIPTGSF